jgi:hypothetical protein
MDTVKIFGRCPLCMIPHRLCRVQTTFGQYGGRERWVPYEFCFAKSRKRALLYDMRPTPVVEVRPGAMGDRKVLAEVIQEWEQAKKDEEIDWEKTKWII